MARKKKAQSLGSLKGVFAAQLTKAYNQSRFGDCRGARDYLSSLAFVEDLPEEVSEEWLSNFCVKQGIDYVEPERTARRSRGNASAQAEVTFDDLKTAATLVERLSQAGLTLQEVAPILDAVLELGGIVRTCEVIEALNVLRGQVVLPEEVASREEDATAEGDVSSVQLTSTGEAAGVALTKLD